MGMGSPPVCGDLDAQSGIASGAPQPGLVSKRGSWGDTEQGWGQLWATCSPGRARPPSPPPSCPHPAAEWLRFALRLHSVLSF